MLGGGAAASPLRGHLLFQLELFFHRFDQPCFQFRRRVSWQGALSAVEAEFQVLAAVPDLHSFRPEPPDKLTLFHRTSVFVEHG